jgi:type IV secretion system protein TrbE
MPIFLTLLCILIAAAVAYGIFNRQGFAVFSLTEHKKVPDRITDYLPWAVLIAPGVAMNKNGSLMTTFRYRGPDLYSATDSGLVAVSAQINNVFRRMPGGWAIYAEGDHHVSADYPRSTFDDPMSGLLDAERSVTFSGRSQFESDYYLTLQYMPPRDVAGRLGALFYEGTNANERSAHQEILAGFQIECARAAKLIGGVVPEMERLDDDGLLTYLHSTVSAKRQVVRAPEVAAYLDAFVADTPLTGGFAPRLGAHHVGVVTVLSYPDTSSPGLLDALNALPFEYRWVTRFICMDKLDAQKAITTYQQRWLSARKRLGTLIREAMMGQESAVQNTDAVNKAADADAALQVLNAGHVSFGHITQSIVILDTDPDALTAKMLEVERVINQLGFTTISENENHNALDAWFGTIPGNTHHNVRHPLVHTLNLTHLFPLSAIWAGPTENSHFTEELRKRLGRNDYVAPPLMVTVTEGCTPYRFSMNVGDVGHLLMIGPTGTGKSVLLNAIRAAFPCYPDAQIISFDYGRSEYVLNQCSSGDFYDLGDPAARPAFQPLRDVDQDSERTWASEWLQAVFRHEGLEVTPERRTAIWNALGSIATMPVNERTLTVLEINLQDVQLKQAIKPYTLNGPYGKFLDSDHDSLRTSRRQCFEMRQMMEESGHIVMPVLLYLFHRLEQRFDGSPTILVLDEGWLFLDDPLFAPKFKAWLKTLRKKLVYVVFASQSPADVAKSTISHVLRESCFTKIFLPNPDALEPETAAFYRQFGLNDAQLRIIATAVPKRDYYYNSPLGNRLFSLALGPIALATIAATGAEDQKLMSQILASDTPTPAADYLAAKGLTEAAEQLRAVGAQRPPVLAAA